MTLRTKVIGRNQTDHGPWVPGTVAGKKFHYQLFGCDWESLHDNNNTPPAVWDGGDIITPNTNDWKKVSGDYQAWLLKQNHPATTGTTGDYPYNGMGRVELAKNMVNTGTDLAPVMVNTLTQDMFYKGAVGSRVPNTNTIFVIRYDYVLAENITIPDSCVLEFEGGSISGAYTLTGVNTIIEGEKNITCTMAGTFSDRSLSTLRGEVTSLNSAVGSGGSVDSRIAQAKTEIIGGANSDYNTLGKTENKLLAEVSRAETVEAQLQQAYAGITQSDIIVGSLPASGTANKIYRVPGSGAYTDYMYYDGAFVQMAEYTADTFAHKSYLSPTPIFNSIFKEFLIQGQSFDITQVTSMYIDKAMYRDSGVYRDQIVLKVGDDEVAQFTIDSETSAKAFSVFPNDVINYGVDINGAMLYFIMDWSSLASNQRHTFNVTLNEGCSKEECNPTIYSFLNNENSYFGFSNIGWGSFVVNGSTGELIDEDRYRFTSGKIYIPKNSVILNFSGLSAGYKYELYFFDFNDNIVRTYEGWKTTSDVYTFPDTAAYLRIMVAKASDPQFFVYDLINDNQNVTIVFTQNDRKYTLCELTVGNMNVRGFADTEESSQKSDNPSVYLPLWKRVMTWVNKDFLTIVEWQDDFDKAGNINSYNTLLKQFYPYHYTINGERGLFSKIPCTFEVRTRNYNQIVAKTTINGKSLAIVAWVQSNSDDAAKVRADSQWMIDYLTDFDLVIVSGDFNNEAGASLLQVWLDNGYILGNSGYWGQIDTCTSSTNPDYAANDNIVVKGFASYDNFEKGSEKVGSDHYPVRADLHYYI